MGRTDSVSPSWRFVFNSSLLYFANRSADLQSARCGFGVAGVKGRIALIRRRSYLRGRSRPVLAEADDGYLYVVKYADPNTRFLPLLGEAAGSLLFGALGLEVPAWRPLEITESFIETIDHNDIQNVIKAHARHSQTAFGSRYMGNNVERVLEILPYRDLMRISNRQDFCKALLFDVCARQSDNRQALFVSLQQRSYLSLFIDHGGLFENHEKDLRKQLIAAMYLDRRIYHALSSSYFESARQSLESLDADAAWGTLRALPNDWLSPEGRSLLAECLDRVSSRHFTEKIVSCALDIIAKSEDFERIRYGQDGKC